MPTWACAKCTDTKLGVQTCSSCEKRFAQSEFKDEHRTAHPNCRRCQKPECQNPKCKKPYPTSQRAYSGRLQEHFCDVCLTPQQCKRCNAGEVDHSKWKRLKDFGKKKDWKCHALCQECRLCTCVQCGARFTEKDPWVPPTRNVNSPPTCKQCRRN